MIKKIHLVRVSVCGSSKKKITKITKNKKNNKNNKKNNKK